MKTLDKETVKKWIEDDISFRQLKGQWPEACYYAYIKQKCSILGYYVTDLNNIIDELCLEGYIVRNIENNQEYFKII